MQLLTSARPSRRTTLHLVGTVNHANVRLSFEAVLAAHLAVRIVGNHSPLRPTLSAIARRALLTYCRSLESMTSEQLQSEARAVAQASKALPPTEKDALEKALDRLEGIPAGSPLPTLAELRYGPSGALDVAALDAVVSQRLQAMHPRRFPHG